MISPSLVRFSLVNLLCVPAAFGAGYYLPNQDAFATAKGNAWVATADGPAAVFYNPAGLTQLTRPEAEAGAYAIRLGNEATIGGTSYDAKSEWQVAPHLYYASPLNDRLSWGIGVNSPFGLGTEWGQATPFRTSVTEARLLYASTTAALGYRVSDTLSVGVSGSVNYSDLKLEQGLGFTPDDFLRFKGDAVSVTGAISARWQPHEKHAFGAQIVTGSDYTLRGRVTSDILGNASANFDFMTPMRIAGGYSFRPAPGWNVEANIEWLDWDSLNDLNLRAANLPGGSTAVPFRWQSMFIYEVGVSYESPGGYRFAAGYDYNGNAQPATTFNPGIADANRHWLNIGAGRKCENWSYFLAYQFGFSDRTVAGTPGNLADGEYKARHHAVVLSLSHQF